VAGVAWPAAGLADRGPVGARNPAANAPTPSLICPWVMGPGLFRLSGPCRVAHGRIEYSVEAVNRVYLLAIDAARKQEGLKPLSLPVDFRTLTPSQQLFVLTNAERQDRGLPPVAGTTPLLSAAAMEAAQEGRDPQLDPDPYAAWGSNWAAGSLSLDGTHPIYPVLAAWYGWMYQDGWGGPGRTFNVACSSPTAPGCWGHRDNILGDWGSHPAVGAGFASSPQCGIAYTLILADAEGAPLSPVLPVSAWRVRFSSDPNVLFPVGPSLAAGPSVTLQGLFPRASAVPGDATAQAGL
jgi:hypothetical protein